MLAPSTGGLNQWVYTASRSHFLVGVPVSTVLHRKTASIFAQNKTTRKLQPYTGIRTKRRGPKKIAGEYPGGVHFDAPPSPSLAPMRQPYEV